MAGGAGSTGVCTTVGQVGGPGSKLTLLMLDYAEMFEASVYVCLTLRVCVLGW